MKKFLFLATILAFNHAHAGLKCATYSSNACQTHNGFMTTQAAGCAGPSTTCRRTFCESVCTPCPGAQDIKNLCQSNCTGIVLNGAEKDVRPIQDKLAKCRYLGAAASYDMALQIQNGNAATQGFASGIQGLVKEYTEAARAQEHALAKVNLANQQVTEIAKKITDAAHKEGYPSPRAEELANDLINALNTKAQQEEGTYALQSPGEVAPTYAGHRSSRRSSRYTRF
jgi:hypothetical protein